MEKNITGALPTDKNAKLNDTDKTVSINAYTKHYLEHKISDIPGARKNSDVKVIDSIINKHKKFHKGDYNYNDADEDLKAAAYLIVHEAAIKYVNGKSKKGKKYKDNFDFCKFASENLKFGLKKYLYNLNTKRLNGSLPDSDNVRKLYFQLPKIKKQQKDFIVHDDYSKLSQSIGLEPKKIKEIDRTLTNYTISGDKELSDENSETLLNTIPDKQISLEENAIKVNLKQKIKELKINILSTFNLRDREIVRQIKFLENRNINKLAKKHNLSSERVRQIAEDKYLLIVNKIKKNLEY
tara:strand:+ start:4347 stop:5234 length:888 start_codon:yes stop_codon:yes gene_type:complete